MVRRGWLGDSAAVGMKSSEVASAPVSTRVPNEGGNHGVAILRPY